MRQRLAVALFLVLLVSWNAWGYDLWAPDEPFFGEGARAMIVDGHWVVPHVGGVVNDHKPPLFFWLIALFSLPAGEVTSLTARLPSMLAFLATAALTFRLGRRLFDEATGLLACVVLGTMLMSWEKARTAQIDALLCFLVLVALSAFEAFRAGGDGRKTGLLFWLAAALAVLAKGPVGFAVPLAVVVATLAFDRNLGALRRFAPVSGPLLLLAVVGAWLLAAELWVEGYSAWGAIQKHVISRAVHGMHHAQPWWYYAEVLPVQLLPWTLLLPGALLLAWRRRREAGDRFLLVAAATVVVFFSIPTEKRNLYVLPAFPFVALLLARFVRPYLPGASASPAGMPSRAWATAALGITASLFLLLAAALPLLARREQPEYLGQALVLAAAAALVGAAMLALLRRHGVAGGVAALAGGMAALYLVGASVLFPALDPVKSVRRFAVAVAERTEQARGAGGRLLSFQLENVPVAMSFYSGGVHAEEADLAAAAAALSPPAAADAPPVFVATSEASLGELEAAAGPLEVLVTSRQARRTLVLVRRPESVP